MVKGRKRKLKILVIGSSGMLGYAASRYFKQRGYGVKELTRREFDIIRNPIVRIRAAVRNADVVINCTGVIKPRIEQYSVEDVLKINSVFPWNLSRLCKQSETRCFHISTDCVFSGKKGGYSEDDFIDAEDLYGLSKAAGDSPLCMTLRTSIVGEEKGHHRSLLEWLRGQKGETADGFVNHRWNGVTTVYLAEILENILTHDLYKPGVFHIYSPKVVTKYKLLRLINDVYGLRVTIRKARSPQAIDRTLTSIYSFSRKLVMKNIRKQIEEMKIFFSTTKQ